MPSRPTTLLATIVCALVLPQDPQFSVSGVVSDAATGLPITGAVVTVSSRIPPFAVSALSLHDGRFLVTGLSAGHFEVRVSKPEFGDATYGSRWTGEPGRPIALSKEQPQQSVNIALCRGAALFGEVSSESGEPLAGASVTAFRVTGLGSSRHAEKVRAVRVDGRGQYRVFGLERGSFVLAVLSGSRSAGPPGGTSEERIDAMLKALRAGRRTPLPPDHVSGASGSDHPMSATVFFPGSSAVGPTGSYNVGCGDEVRDDLVVPTVWAGSVSGSVLGLGLNRGAEVTLEPREAVDTGVANLRSRVASTDPSGGFAFRAVSPGTYTVIAHAEPDQGTGSRGQWGVTTIEVTAGAPTPTTVELRDGLDVVGRVTAAEGSQSRLSPQSVSVELRAVSGYTTALRTVPDGDGHFRFRDLPPEEYRVFVTSRPNSRWVAESATCAGIDALDRLCDFTSIGASELVVTMTDTPAGITGRLETSDGTPPDDLMAVAFPRDERDWAEDSRRIKVARVAADGEFAFDIPPGAYWLGVVTSGTVVETVSDEMLRRLTATAVPVQVSRGQVVRQNIRVGR